MASLPGKFFILSAMAWLLTVLFGPAPALASGKAKIAVLVSYENPSFQQALAGFRDYLRQQGVPTDFDVISLQASSGRPISLPWREAIPKKKVALILALGTPALKVAEKEGGGIPVVAGMVLRKKDILRVPDATGVFLEFPLKTQFSWLHRILPQAHTIGVLYNPAENGERIRAASRLAADMGFELIARKVFSPQQIPEALESLANRVDVLWGLSDRVVVTPQTARSLLLFSFRNRIPFIGLSAPWVKAGAFYALDRDYRDIGRQCGELAEKVLGGTPPSALPPVPPRRITFSLNLRTAERMKIDIPLSLRREASKLF